MIIVFKLYAVLFHLSLEENIFGLKKNPARCLLLCHKLHVYNSYKYFSDGRTQDRL